MNTQITFTPQEQKVIDAIKELKKNGDYVFATDLENDFGMDMKIIRGTLASLVKKGVVEVNKKDDGLISLFI